MGRSVKNLSAAFESGNFDHHDTGGSKTPRGTAGKSSYSVLSPRSRSNKAAKKAAAAADAENSDGNITPRGRYTASKRRPSFMRKSSSSSTAPSASVGQAQPASNLSTISASDESSSALTSTSSGGDGSRDTASQSPVAASPASIKNTINSSTRGRGMDMSTSTATPSGSMATATVGTGGSGRQVGKLSRTRSSSQSPRPTNKTPPRHPNSPRVATLPLEANESPCAAASMSASRPPSLPPREPQGKFSKPTAFEGAACPSPSSERPKSASSIRTLPSADSVMDTPSKRASLDVSAIATQTSDDAGPSTVPESPVQGLGGHQQGKSLAGTPDGKAASTSSFQTPVSFKQVGSRGAVEPAESPLGARTGAKEGEVASSSGAGRGDSGFVATGATLTSSVRERRTPSPIHPATPMAQQPHVIRPTPIRSDGLDGALSPTLTRPSSRLRAMPPPPTPPPGSTDATMRLHTPSPIPVDAEHRSVTSNAPIDGLARRARSDGLVVMKHRKDVSASMLRRIQKMDKLCDLSMWAHENTDGTGEWGNVRAHRVVVAAASPILSTLVSEASQARGCEIRFDQDVSLWSLQAILDFVYTGETTVMPDRVLALAKAADELGIEELRHECEAFATAGLAAINASRMLVDSDVKGLAMVRKRSFELVLREFGAVAQTPGFLQFMDARMMEEVLRSDRLRVHNEEVVFDALIAWLKVGGRGRTQYVANRLLPYVRFPLMRPERLLSIQAQNQGLVGSQMLANLVEEANTFQLLSAQPTTVRSECSRLMPHEVRTTRRRQYECDALKMECERTVVAHKEAIVHAVDCGGGRVATAGADGMVKIWDTSLWVLRQAFRAHRRSVNRMTCFHDKLLTASDDGTIKVWDARSWACEKTLRGHTGPVHCMLHVDNKLLSSGSDRRIRVWNTLTWACERVVETGHTGSVWCLVAHDGKLFTGGGSGDETIRAWNAETWECVIVLRAHTGGVEQLLVYNDAGEDKLVSASDDGTVKAWNMATLRCEQTVDLKSGFVSSIIVSDDMLLTGTGSAQLQVTDPRTWEKRRAIEAHEDGGVTAMIHVDGDKLLSTSSDGTIKLWSCQDWVEVNTPTE